MWLSIIDSMGTGPNRLAKVELCSIADAISAGSPTSKGNRALGKKVTRSGYIEFVALIDCLTVQLMWAFQYIGYFAMKASFLGSVSGSSLLRSLRKYRYPSPP